MDSLSELFPALLVLFLVLGLPVWRWLVWRKRLRGINSALGNLAKNIAELRSQFSALEADLRSKELPLAPVQAPAAPEAVETAGPVAPSVIPATAGAAATRIAPPEGPTVPAGIPGTEELPTVREPVSGMEPGVGPWAPPVPEAPEERRAQPARAARVAWRPVARLLTALKAAGSTTEWETLIGGRWLNKIGVAVLVIGMALLLNYTLRYVGSLGKVVLGSGTSCALILGGAWLEQRRGYAIIAKSLIGGGWALLYFTAYAAYNIEAARVITDPVLGLMVLIVAAAGVIAHSLKYRSQTATGIAYFLGFLAIDISPLTVYSLVAVAVLAASLSAILRKMNWPILGAFGIAATYFTHFVWTVWTPPQAGASVDQAFWLSQGMLVIYWLLFASDDIRAASSGRRRLIYLAPALLNTIGFLGLSALQTWSMFPGDLYLLAGASAIAYAAKGFLVHRVGWPALYRIDGLTAVAALSAATTLAVRAMWIPAEWLAPALLGEALLVLLVGFRSRDYFIRFGAYLLSGGALFIALAFNVFALHGLYDLGVSPEKVTSEVMALLRTLYIEPPAQRLLRWITVTPIIGVLLFFEWLQVMVGRREVEADETAFARSVAYGAALLLACLLWQQVPHAFVGLAWLGASASLFELGVRAHYPPYRVHAYGLFALAVAALLLVNLYGVLQSGTAFAPSLWVAVIPAVVVGYCLFWRLWRFRGTFGGDVETRWAAWFAHAASGLLVVVLWKELDPAAVALAWGMLALATYELGRNWSIHPLEQQSHVLSAISFGRLFLANFTAPGTAFGLSVRLITVAPVLALLLYRDFTAKYLTTSVSMPRFERIASPVYLYAATFGLAVLARFELDRSHAVIAWAILSLGYLGLGTKLRDPDLRYQSHLLAIAAFARSWGTNFYLTGSYYGLPERMTTTVPVIAALFASGLLWRSARDEFRKPETGPGILRALAFLDWKSRVVMEALASALLASLLFYSVKGNLLTIVWALEGFVLLIAGFATSERVLRWCGLILLAVCLFKVFIVDLSGVETIYRIFSFIVLGLILVAVSLIYTRYREFVKRYL